MAQTMLLGMVMFLCMIFPVIESSANIGLAIDFASSPNPVGSGSRALGMGGAFIGVADDATAASWNPAGLIQLETPEISIVGAYSHRIDDSVYTFLPEASGTTSVTLYDLNYLSGTYPFVFYDRNMVVSLNYQHLYDFSENMSYTRQYMSPPGAPPQSRQEKFEYEENGSWGSISPAMAVRFGQVSLGLTLNFWENGLSDNTWKQEKHMVALITTSFDQWKNERKISHEYEMSGFNFNLGLMWDINEKLTMGAVFKSPFTANLDHTYQYTDIKVSLDSYDDQYKVDGYTDHVDLEMPMSFGIGLAIRFNDSFSMALDVYRTEWNDFILSPENGEKISPVTGETENNSSVGPTIQVRIGGEFLFIGDKTIVPCRAGLFYDPEPAAKSSDDFWGVSIGTGIAYKSIVYDIAYQYRFGNDVRTPVPSDDSGQDIKQHTVSMSLVYHF